MISMFNKKTFLKYTSVILSTALLASCGGGGGSKNEATARPKTLEGLVLRLDGQTIELEFIRNANSPTEATIANPERGSILYDIVDGDFQFHQTTTGGAVDFWWPQSVASATYQYRPINDSSGEILVTSNGPIHLTTGPPFIVDGSARVGEGINTPASIRLFGSTGNITRFVVTFDNNGSVITGLTMTVGPSFITPIPFTIRGGTNANPTVIQGNTSNLFSFNSGTSTVNPQTPFLPTIAQASYLTGGTLTTRTGASVPFNYTNELDYQSRISLPSLNGQSITFTPNAANPYSIVCTTPSPAFSGGTEDGTCVYADANLNVVFNSAEYEYTQTVSDDTATFTLIDELTLNTTPGIYTLNFLTPSSDTQRASGTYRIVAPGLPHNNEVGRFIITNADILAR